ncbi:MAG: hypothetical protein JWN16_1134 [Alphaproteobacteria bacterium]|nr:hypothetical protein [Alphaproteobacteria bacterium]
MVTFLAIRGERGWVVERTEPSGLKIVISREHPTKYEAEVEANKLNQEAARRTMN